MCFFLIALPARADDLKVSGLASLDVRFFTQKPLHPGQGEGPELSLALSPEFSAGQGPHQYVLAPFYRQDSMDSSRTHFDLRKAYWRTGNDEWSFLVGVNQVSWDIAVSHHLINIINQADTVEDVVTEHDRLGQPMLNLTSYNDWGQLDFYVLPGFRERTFPGEDGRLRAPLPVDTNHPIFESAAQEKHIDFSASYKHAGKGWDVSLHAFHGTSREPAFVVNNAGTYLLPVYGIISQVGTGLRYTTGQWTWKFEGLAREGQGKFFQAYIAGFHYIFPNILDSNAELGLMAEYSYDNRNAAGGFTSFDKDIFSGFWIGLHDEKQTVLSATSTTDVDTQESFLNFQMNTHITADVEIELMGRVFTNVPEDGEIYPATQDDHIQLHLIRYF